MIHAHSRLSPWLPGMALLVACSAQQAELEDIGVVDQALSACNETVAADRFVDGIPAYAQCPSTFVAPIYSNDGVNTSTTPTGPDWVITQFSGGYQCTELIHRYWHFKFKVDWSPNGNAGFWCDSPPPPGSGVEQTMSPVHGDAIVLAPGSCFASATTGHVALVDTVDASGLISVTEQNQARRGIYQKTCAKCFLHVIANDGAGQPAGTPGAAPPPAPPPAPVVPAPLAPAPTPGLPPSPAAPPASAPAVPAPIDSLGAAGSGGAFAGSDAPAMAAVGVPLILDRVQEAEPGCSAAPGRSSPCAGFLLSLIAAVAVRRRLQSRTERRPR